MEKYVFIYTYGCQMNVHDSEKIRGVLSQSGYKKAETPADADLIIFNTCAIREKAEHKFYSQLGRIKFLKTAKKDLKIAVAGCVAQDAKNRILKRAPYVDYVFGPQNISSLTDLILNESGVSVNEDPEIADFEFNTLRNSGSRAWVSIMYGCNNFCTYCIVPFTRGREISRSSSSIVAEIAHLYNSGYKEVTLLGQNVNSYSSDTDFPGLLKKIDQIGINRVRFVTSHPRDMSMELIDAISELPSLCEHIHLPIQSGSDRILTLMNRRYTYADYMKKIEVLRKKVPGISVTADVIVGFPGETEEDYLLTIRAIEEIEYDGLFAFKYSIRKGTKAYELEDHLTDKTKAERLNYLLGVQEEIAYKKNMLLEDTVQEILIEGSSESNQCMLNGRTRSNKIVTIPDNEEKEGELVMAFIKRARHHSLEGVRTVSDSPLSL